jgi:hypothetical protein
VRFEGCWSASRYSLAPCWVALRCVDRPGRGNTSEQPITQSNTRGEVRATMMRGRLDQCTCCTRAKPTQRLTALVLTGNGPDPPDRALAHSTVKRMRDVLLLLQRNGVTGLVGLQRARSARWRLAIDQAVA